MGIVIFIRRQICFLKKMGGLFKLSGHTSFVLFLKRLLFAMGHLKFHGCTVIRKSFGSGFLEIVNRRRLTESGALQ